MPTMRLIISCPDQPGIVSDVSTYVFRAGGNIAEANQYHDPLTGMFFMRYVIETAAMQTSVDQFEAGFAPTAERFSMTWRLTRTDRPRSVLIMVSKLDHCLTDLLYRWKCNELAFEIPCVISNHEDLRSYVEWHDIDYHCVPVPRDAKGKAVAFGKTEALIDQHSPDTIVLARYMQILPPSICTKYANQVINIHHSFLPSFAGARPYHQASQRGVKLTGATCHYVTEDLDAGPIIEQDVIRISHHDSIDEIVRLGKDVEKTVLARGLRYHLEDRVLVHNNKTVVFS